ncbi:MAG: AraC family transcriptional regulator [Ferruginibacter sp.]
MPQPSAYDIECLQKAIAVIERDHAVRHTVRELAIVAGMGITKFQSAFKMYAGYNVFEFVREQRMKKAQLLVIENYHSIKTIAQLCGYRYSSHFNTAFKKRFGISAKRIRSQIKI